MTYREKLQQVLSEDIFEQVVLDSEKTNPGRLDQEFDWYLSYRFIDHLIEWQKSSIGVTYWLNNHHDLIGAVDLNQGETDPRIEQKFFKQ